jgi:hypothetical protein
MLGSPTYGRLAGLLAPDEGERGSDDSRELELRVWSAPARMAARLDFHGNWLEWVG